MYEIAGIYDGNEARVVEYTPQNILVLYLRGKKTSRYCSASQGKTHQATSHCHG